MYVSRVKETKKTLVTLDIIAKLDIEYLQDTRMDLT